MTAISALAFGGEEENLDWWTKLYNRLNIDFTNCHRRGRDPGRIPPNACASVAIQPKSESWISKDSSRQ
jgi:hypothetical protein